MRKKISIEVLEKKIDQEEEVVDQFFDVKNARLSNKKNTLEKRTEIVKTNLDLTTSMLNELDELAKNLNISRQSVVKMILRQSLDNHYMAQHNRKINIQSV